MSIKSDNQNAVDAYIAQITAEYNAAEQLIEIESQDAGHIINDNALIQELFSELNIHYTASQAEIDQMNADIQSGNIDDLTKLLTTMMQHRTSGGSIPDGWFEAQNAKIIDWVKDIQTNVSQEKAAAAQLEQIDPAMADLDSALQSLQFALEVGQTADPGDLIAEDTALLNKTLQTLVQGMQQKLQSDKFAALIQNDTDGQLSNAQLEAFAAQMIQGETAEQGTFSQLQTDLEQAFESYHTQYDNANSDQYSYNMWQKWFSDSADASIDRDHEVMANAKMMEKVISAILTAIAPEVASLNPEMMQIQIIMESVMKRIQKILSDITLTPKQQVGALLALMMFALGIFQQVQQEVQSQKAKNQQGMSQANLDASQMNLEDTEMNQQIQQEEEANAKAMKVLSTAMQITMGAIMTILAPGIGTAALMGLVTVLEATGVMNTLTDKLASAVGSQIAAQVLVGVFEITATAGGGALEDLAEQAFAKTAVAAAVTAAENSVKQAVEDGAKLAAKGVGQEMAAQVIQTAVNKAVTSAAEKTAAAFFKQNAASLVTMIAKGTLRSSLNSAVTKAAEEAAQNAIADSAILAQLGARGVAVEQDIVAVANRAADKAVADTANLSVKDVKALGRSGAGKAVDRAVWTAVYNFGSNDYLTQLITMMQKKTGGNSNSKDFQNFLIFIQLLQSLIQMIAMTYGSGMVNSASFGANNITRLANLLSALPQAGNLAAAIGTYDIRESQGGVVEALTKNEGIADLLHAFLEQIQKDGTISMNQYTAQQTQNAQMLQAMSAHLEDGDRAGIQVLVAAAS